RRRPQPPPPTTAAAVPVAVQPRPEPRATEWRAILTAVRPLGGHDVLHSRFPTPHGVPAPMSSTPQPRSEPAAERETPAPPAGLAPTVSAAPLATATLPPEAEDLLRELRLDPA